MSNTAYVAVIPDCDIHTHTFNKPGVPAAVDGRTVSGRWANMCDGCYERYGVGLGTGKGQRLVVREERPTPAPGTVGAMLAAREAQEEEARIRAAVHEAILAGDYEAFEDACGDRDPMEFL